MHQEIDKDASFHFILDTISILDKLLLNAAYNDLDLI